MKNNNNFLIIISIFFLNNYAMLVRLYVTLLIFLAFNYKDLLKI